METIDPKKAAAVWQRVRSSLPSTQPENNLLTLLRREQQCKALCDTLQRRMPKEMGALSRDSQARIACLRGMYALSVGAPPRLQPTPAERSRPQMLLRRCYTLMEENARGYAACREDAHWGDTYAQLAAEAQNNCRRLLMLLGSNP